LGANDGPSAAYDWEAPSLFPKLLPWVMVLLLLALRANRNLRAWLIWLPLVASLAVQAGLGVALGFIPSEPLDMLCQVVLSLAFGAAALWLTFPCLTSRYRFLAFLKAMLVLGFAASLAFATGQDWADVGGEVIAGFVAVGMLALVTAAALTLSGRNCRRRYHPLRLSLWLVVWLAVGAIVVLTPFAVFAALTAGVEAAAGFGAAILAGVAVAFGSLLPFLLLSFANLFYRERLKQWLLVEVATSPPVLPALSVSPLTERPL